jgi:8-oxo-dGTP pyrophosphatase MutT (NUDIX family)
MKKEKSCGAVVYKYQNNQLLFLLIKSKKGHHFSFPKGHVENDETEVETALREIKEETNLDVLVDTGYRNVITYSPMENVLKDVIYFVATPISDAKVIVQEAEVSSAKWLYYSQALKQVTHDNEKQVLIKAYEYLKNKKE